jgi:hypothetical protein
MPRNISFALTTNQIRNRTKTVTRRLKWHFVKVGDILNACVKCQGIKPGEKIERICQIRVVDVRREPLFFMETNDRASRNVRTIMSEFNGRDYPKDYGYTEAIKEGFPSMSGSEFVQMFCENMGGDHDQDVTRIEFEYLDN